MAKQYARISDPLARFIDAQKMFFVATAAPTGRVNLSPKGMDTLRVLDPNRVAWLSVTGSGNETAAHLLQNSRMTIMFCAFEGHPNILRLYGDAVTHHRGDADYDALAPLFPQLPGARNIFVLDVDLVQTSCGMAVPCFDYSGDRDDLNEWALRKGADGLEDYWADKNMASLDGDPTGLPLPTRAV
ncbi:pyridoxamine 5'-phosphate oxidase family protein [soil metagenome]